MQVSITSQLTRDVDPMVGQRRRQWPKIKTTLSQRLVQCLVFAGKEILMIILPNP